MKRYDFLTLHPDLLRGPMSCSIMGRAVDAGTIEVGIHDIRDAATDRHRSVDDAPYGGGAGMVMRVDIVARALAAVRTSDSHVVLTSAAGRPFQQADAERFSKLDHLVFLCGHYEGIDARVETLVDEEVSLGDFVLTGGELAAAVIVDATARLVPGVVGNTVSVLDESFSQGLLEYPQFTRPRIWEGLEVPEVLLSGHHGKIRKWRQQCAEARTKARRPDLWGAWNATGSPGVIDEDPSGL